MIRDHELAVVMRADLDRRLGEIARAESRDFGQIGAAEWALAVVGFVVVPLVLWFWFR